MARVKRPIRVEGDLAYVPLTKGYEAIIDAVDVPLVEGWNWRAQVSRRPDGSIRAVYATREAHEDGKSCAVYMHRTLLSVTPETDGDHIDGNGINNRRANLREATAAQNQHNQRTRADNTSGVKGVDWNKGRQKWRARIKINKQSVLLGLFTSIADAAKAYADASAKHHGKFGRLE
ncbi:MAG: hypothetical protein ACRC14_02580 [Paracoccaceae bacterium]